RSAPKESHPSVTAFPSRTDQTWRVRSGEQSVRRNGRAPAPPEPGPTTYPGPAPAWSPFLSSAPIPPRPAGLKHGEWIALARTTRSEESSNIAASDSKAKVHASRDLRFH